MNQRVTVSFSIPATLKEKIELFAQNTKRTQSAVVEMAFEKFLDSQEVKESLPSPCSDPQQ